MALTTSLTLNLLATLTGTTVLGAAPTHQAQKNIQQTLTNGTGLNEADQQLAKSYAISTSSSQSIDLAGSTTNALGETVTFDKIKGILIHVTTTTAGTAVEIGGGDNPFVSFVKASGDALVLGPGGIALLWNPSAAGYAVTADTGDILKITNTSAHTVNVDVIIVGTADSA